MNRYIIIRFLEFLHLFINQRNQKCSYLRNARTILIIWIEH